MKKVSVILLSLIVSIFTLNVKAEPITYDRNDYPNYGVNKKWDITESNVSNVLNTYLVNADEKIYDFADILTDEEEANLKEKVKSFVNQYKTDMVILTIDKSYVYDSLNETIASDFYDYNDFGIDFEHYSGILLLRNTYSSDPYFNVYMFGDAQLVINYNRSENILYDIYNDLHLHRYETGFSRFIFDVREYYKKGKPFSERNYYIDDMGYIKKRYVPPYFLATIFAVIVTAIYIPIQVRKNKMVQKARKADEYLAMESIKYNRREDKFVTSRVSSYTSSSSSGGGGGGGHHSSGGSSGGGHSSGGGRHG